MKKFKLLLKMFSLLLVTCFIFAGCDGNNPPPETAETYYVAASDFFYSEDKGHTYGNGTKEYSIGETVYMKVKAKVTSNQTNPKTITMKLTIPNITALDAKYFDGQPITPVYDSVLNVTTYEFTITAAQNAQEWEFVFQFIPNAEAEVKITLEFDENIESMYDKQNTVKFVDDTVVPQEPTEPQDPTNPEGE